MSIAKVTEVISSSEKSFEDAIREIARHPPCKFKTILIEIDWSLLTKQVPEKP